MSVKVSLNGDGLSFEAETTVLQAAQIIGFLGNETNTMPLNANPSLSYEGAQPSLGMPTKPVSPRERLIEVNAKTNPQKILTLGQYVIDRDRSENFSAADIKSLFGRAGEPIPRNLGRDIREAVRLGFIYEDESISDHFIVTGKGLEALGAGFAGDTSKGPRSASSRKRTPRKNGVSTVSESVKNMVVSDVKEGLPNYRTLAQKSDRLMWVLAYAQEAGIEMLTAKEIEDIAQRLSDNIPARQIAPFTQTALKRGYLSKTSDGYRILFSGIRYLKDKIATDDTEE